MKVFFWDHSCTLVDDVDAVIHTHNTILDMYGKDPIGHDQFKDVVRLSNTYVDNYRIWGILDEDPVLEERGGNYIGFLYENIFPTMRELVLPYPYVDTEEVLASTASMGIKNIVVSLHPQEDLERQLEMFGLKKYISEIYGGVKDKADLMSDILKRLRVSPENAAIIGDTHYDSLFGEKTGVVSIAKYNGGFVTNDILDDTLREMKERSHPCFGIYNLSDLMKRIEIDARTGHPYLIIDSY